jgi:hypothetical protein
MTSKKKGQLTKFCRIFPWIELQDSDFAGAIRDLCMEGNLSPGHYGTGITFLYPKDKSYREEIVSKAYSDQADEAIRLIESLILPVLVTSAADFRGDIGSKLGIKIEVEGVTGDKIKLKNGAVIVPVNSFKPLKRDNISVWMIDSGRAPMEGPEFKPPKRVRGGVETTEEQPKITQLSKRAELASTVELNFDRCMRTDRCISNNPYLENSVSLLAHLKRYQLDLFTKVLPIIDRDPGVTFYLLVEPYKTHGEYLLPNDVLYGENGWNGTMTYEDPVSEYKSFFENLSSNDGNSANNNLTGRYEIPKAFSEPDSVRSMVDQMRTSLTGNLNKVRTPTDLRALYATLESTNTIGGFGPILPESTLKALKNGKKLWQDEFRFLLHAKFQQLGVGQSDDGLNYSSTEYAGEIVRFIRDHMPGNNYSHEAKLSNLEAFSHDVHPTERFAALTGFINSTDFLYTPVPSEKIGGFWGGGTNNFDSHDPRTMGIYNAERSKEMALNRYNTTIKSGLSPQTILEIRTYISRHGKLPPEISNIEN